MTGEKDEQSTALSQLMANGDYEAKQKSYLRYRLIKQVCLVCTWMAMGAYYEIIGPTVPDLRALMSCSYEQISGGIAMRSVGYFVGALFGGFGHELFHKRSDVIMALGLILAGAGTFFIPWSSTIPMFTFWLFLQGTGTGLGRTGGPPMMMELWGKKAAAPMHSIQFAYDLGAIVVTQLAKPFLATETQPEKVNASSSNSNIYANGSSFISHNISSPASEMGTVLANTESAPGPADSSRLPLSTSHLVYPYMIVAIYCAIVAVLWFVVNFTGVPESMPQRKTTTTLRKMLSPASCSQGNTLYGSFLLACLFFYFFSANGGETLYTTYIVSYAFDAKVEFSLAQAVELTMVVRGALLLGRFCGIFIGHLVKVQYVISIDAIIGTAIFICFVIFATESVMALWVLSVGGGLFMSVVFANGMVWGNLYIVMNSIATMICSLGGAAGPFIYMYIAGYLFDEYGVYTLGHIMIFYFASILAVFILMQFTAHFNRTDIFNSRIITEKAVDEDPNEIDV